MKQFSKIKDFFIKPYPMNPLKFITLTAISALTILTAQKKILENANNIPHPQEGFIENAYSVSDATLRKNLTAKQVDKLQKQAQKLKAEAEEHYEESATRASKYKRYEGMWEKNLNLTDQLTILTDRLPEAGRTNSVHLKNSEWPATMGTNSPAP